MASKPKQCGILRRCGDCKRLNRRILDGAAALCLYRFKTIAPWNIDAKTVRATFCRGFEQREDLHDT